MTTYNTPYKSGTISSFSGTSLTVAGFTPAAGDVGRLVVITSGDARLQHRLITAVSGSTLTLAHSWDTQPFIDTSSDQRASDQDPTAGDAIAISYDAADLIAGDADMTLTDRNHLKIAAVRVEGNAYIHFKDYHIEWDYPTVDIAQGGGLILGYYGYVAGADGYVTNSCNVVEDTTTTTNGISLDPSSSMGMLDIYGGNVYVPGGLPFWRPYSTEAQSRDQQVRWVEVTAYGNFGSRTAGDRSMLIRCTAVGAESTLGFSNPRGSVARVEISAVNSNQAGYVWLSTTDGGPSGRLVFPRLADIGVRVIRCVTSGHSGTNVMEVIAKKAEVDAAPAFIVVEGVVGGSHTFRYGNLVRPTFVDAVGAAVTDSIKAVTFDSTPASVNAQTITTGAYAEQFVRHTDISTTVGALNLADGTLFAPYVINSITYLKNMLSTTVSAEDTFDAALVLLDDPLITEATEATALAYTTQETPQKAYDHLKALLVRDFVGETAPTVTRVGDTLDFGALNVTIDGTGSGEAVVVAGASVTLNAATFTGNITTTGVVTQVNGATVAGGVLDANGDSFLSFSGIDSWTVYANSADADANTNALGTGGAADSFRFNYVAATTYHLRTTAGASTILQMVTPAAAGETVVSLSIEALLTLLPSATEVADAVWDEVASEHMTAGSTGEALTNGVSSTSGLSWEGNWDAGTAYEQNDLVTHNDMTWVSGGSAAGLEPGNEGATSFDVAPTNSGATAYGDALAVAGDAYLMYSAESVHTRFQLDPRPPLFNNADHLIVVVWDGTNWYYASQSATNPNESTQFTPVASDRLIWTINLTNFDLIDPVATVISTETVINGINAGVATTDIVVNVNTYSGVTNAGEYDFSGGTNFTITSPPGATWELFTVSVDTQIVIDEINENEGLIKGLY